MFQQRFFDALIKAGRITDALNYIHDCVPEYLCKWYSLQDDSQEGICEHEQEKRKSKNAKRFKSLSNSENWFDTRFNQNDPFDMQLYDLDYDRIKKEKMEEFIPVYEEVLNMLRDSLLLCSFCDSEINNLPMWANYSNNHQGYCVKYKVNNKKLFYKICYTPTIAMANDLINAVVHDANIVHEQKKPTKETDELRAAFLIVNNCKHDSWKSENEYRCLYPITNEKLKGRNVSNNIIGLVPEEIYIGLNCSEKNKKELIRIAHEKIHCRVFVCKKSRTDFLTFEEC